MKQFIMNYWWIAFSIGIFLWLAKTSISFHPFKITMKEPFSAIGWFMVVIGIAFIVGQNNSKSEMKGYERGIKEMSEEIQNSIRDGSFFDN